MNTTLSLVLFLIGVRKVSFRVGGGKEVNRASSQEFERGERHNWTVSYMYM